MEHLGVAVFHTTDIEHVRELASNPEIELDITHLYTDNGPHGLPRQDYTKLPEHVKAKLITRHIRLVMTNVITCADIFAPYCKRFYAPKLQSAGKLHFRYARQIMAEELTEAEEI